MEGIMAKALKEKTIAQQIGIHAITQPSSSQSVDQKLLLLLRRKGAQTIDGLTILTGIGWGQIFLSVDRLSRTGKVLLTAVYPAKYRVSVGRTGGFTKVINTPYCKQ
jgi:hypothetical protein